LDGVTHASGVALRDTKKTLPGGKSIGVMALVRGDVAHGRGEGR